MKDKLHFEGYVTLLMEILTSKCKKRIAIARITDYFFVSLSTKQEEWPESFSYSFSHS